MNHFKWGGEVMNSFEWYKAADYKKFYLKSSTAGHPYSLTTLAVFNSEAFTQINSSLCKLYSSL